LLVFRIWFYVCLSTCVLHPLVLLFRGRAVLAFLYVHLSVVLLRGRALLACPFVCMSVCLFVES
jgi:hypothetical protein